MAATLQCYNCGGFGHAQRACPSPAGFAVVQPVAVQQPRRGRRQPGAQAVVSPAAKTAAKCRLCGKGGHTQRECWHNPRNAAAAAVAAQPAAPKRAGQRTCSNCGSKKHLGRDCPRLPAAERSAKAGKKGGQPAAAAAKKPKKQQQPAKKGAKAAKAASPAPKKVTKEDLDEEMFKYFSKTPEGRQKVVAEKKDALDGDLDAYFAEAAEQNGEGADEVGAGEADEAAAAAETA